MYRCLAILILATACAEDRHDDDRKPERSYDGPITFADAPACPAPHTPQAVHYQESGGASNALLWYMTMHALSGPSYEVHHHHHGYAPTRYVTRPVVQRAAYRPAYKPTPAPSYSRPTTAPKAPILTPSVGGRAPAWTAKPSQSFGYKAPAAKPSSASFRPSSAPRPAATTTIRSSPSPSRRR
jgi:hypothetical protein